MARILGRSVAHRRVNATEGFNAQVHRGHRSAEGPSRRLSAAPPRAENRRRRELYWLERTARGRLCDGVLGSLQR